MNSFIEHLNRSGIFDAAIAAAAVITVYLIVRVIFLTAKKLPRKSIPEEIFRALLAGYIAALLVILEVPKETWQPLLSGEMSWTELRRLGTITHNGWIWQFVFTGRRGVLGGLLENVVLFVPYGFLLPMIWRELKWWQVWLICLTTTCSLERLQPLVGRTGDLDDVITNFIGGVIGCAIAKFVLKIINSRN